MKATKSPTKQPAAKGCAPLSGSEAQARADIHAEVDAILADRLAKMKEYGMPMADMATERSMAWAAWAKKIPNEEIASLILQTAAPLPDEEPWKHIFEEIWRRLRLQNAEPTGRRSGAANGSAESP